MSTQSVILFLIFLTSCLKVNSQVPTVPTVGPTDPTTTTTLRTTIPAAPTKIPSAPTINTSTSTTPSSFICPPDGIRHYPVSNCQEFIVCVYGRQHMGRCADGTLFDPPTSSCLSANVVDCENRYRP